MILVTGGSGLVGQELIFQLLEQGNKVKAIYNSTSLTIQHKDVTPIKCNILDTDGLEEVMQGVTQLYHCAAIVSFSPKNKDQLLKINVEGTANVVNAALDAGVKKMVHVSSIAALGRIRENQNVTEEMNWTEESSNSIYGKSKYLGELEVWRGIGEGLEAVIVNPSLVFGGGDWNKGSSEIFKSVYNEFPWYTEGVTGVVDVKDVVRAMILLMNSEISRERFILNAENLSYKEIFNCIANCFGKKIPHKKVTPFIASVVWRWEALKSMFSGKNALVTKETTRTALAKVYFDNSKILNALPGFQFTSINETIKNTCATLKQINHL
ncbi:MAG TPA: NAD-dependent epimerase/dehydratase family protein [Chitinophagaceae bacterium]|nr:NAD-dependent epimerase/dehydratase family protein [Chitinophagaceae bacterium]